MVLGCVLVVLCLVVAPSCCSHGFVFSRHGACDVMDTVLDFPLVSCQVETREHEVDALKQKLQQRESELRTWHSKLKKSQQEAVAAAKRAAYVISPLPQPLGFPPTPLVFSCLFFVLSFLFFGVLFCC